VVPVHCAVLNSGLQEMILHVTWELESCDIHPNDPLSAKCLFSHTSQKAQLRAPLSPLQTAWTDLAKAYANNLWSVTEPEAVGVPGWQTGAKALCLYSQSSQAYKPVRRTPT